MAAKLRFLFVLLGARNTFLWGKKIIPMGYFFVKQYGESTSENSLPHWIDEDYKLYDHRLHRWTQIILTTDCGCGYSPTDSTDIHRFFLNTNNSNILPQITQIYTDYFDNGLRIILIIKKNI